MKKITTNLKLKGMQKRLTESYGNLGRYEHYSFKRARKPTVSIVG